MGLLSDIFSGKKQADAVARLKKKALTWTIAGTAMLSPVNAAASNMSPEKDAIPDKTEIVQNRDSLRAQTDSVIAKFDDYRLKSAAERMMRTETGRAVLTELSKKDIPVELAPGIGSNLGGAYYPSSKKILINPACSDDMIASILVHEGTHALQAANGCRLGPYLNMQSYINLNKAMEADAMKNQLFASAELKSLGDASVYYAFASEHSDLVSSYKSFCEKYGAQKDSVAKYTMLAYYNDYSYVKEYENRYLGAINSFYKSGKKNTPSGLFQINVSEAEMINRICHLNGHYYMNAADSVLLQDSARNYVLKSTYSSLEKISKKHADLIKENSFLKHDTSYKNFHVIDYKGRVIQAPEKTGQKKKYQPYVMKQPVSRRMRQNGR